MSDLIERLRARAGEMRVGLWSPEWSAMLDEAADALEAAGMRPSEYRDHYREKYERLRALTDLATRRNGELWAVLHKIGQGTMDRLEIIALAREALK